MAPTRRHIRLPSRANRVLADAFPCILPLSGTSRSAMFPEVQSVVGVHRGEQPRETAVLSPM
jgi:hypothetical protein